MATFMPKVAVAAMDTSMIMVVDAAVVPARKQVVAVVVQSMSMTMITTTNMITKPVIHPKQVVMAMAAVVAAASLSFNT